MLFSKKGKDAISSKILLKARREMYFVEGEKQKFAMLPYLFGMSSAKKSPAGVTGDGSIV